MRRASFFLSLAAGLVASLALTAPTQAGPITYDATAFVSVLTGSATFAQVQFNQAVQGPVVILPSTTLTNVVFDGFANGGTAADFSFTAAPASKTYDLEFSLTSTSGLVLKGGVISGSPEPNGGITGFVTAVPEPTTMGLLGIGMAGFFAYRRLFKRPAVA